MISQFEAGHLKILDAKTGGPPCGATNLFAKSWQAMTHESHIDRAQIQLVENQVLRQKRSCVKTVLSMKGETPDIFQLVWVSFGDITPHIKSVHARKP